MRRDIARYIVVAEVARVTLSSATVLLAGLKQTVRRLSSERDGRDHDIVITEPGRSPRGHPRENPAKFLCIILKTVTATYLLTPGY